MKRKGASNKSGILKAGDCWGYKEFYELKPDDAVKAKSWGFVCGFEYEVSLSDEAQPAKASSSSTLQNDLLDVLEATPHGDAHYELPIPPPPQD